MAKRASAATTGVVPWLSCVLVAAFGVIAVWSAVLSRYDRAGSGALAIGHVALAVVGTLIVTRSGSRTIGWLLVAVAVGGAALVAANNVGIYLVERDGITVRVRVLVSTVSVLFNPIAVCVVMIGLTFPNGRPLSPRWKPALWLTLFLGATGSVEALFEGWLHDDPAAWLRDGGWSGSDDARPVPLAVVSALWDVTLVGLFGAAAVCLLIRFQRSEGVERNQVRWVVFAGVFLVASFVVMALPIDSLIPQLLPGVVAVVVAGAFAVAIFRHRLWNLDVVVRRSIIYGVLWALIAGVYMLLAAGFGVAASSRLPVGIAIMVTVTITVVFEPVRRLLEAFASRRVFGRRPNPIEAIGELSDRVATADHVADIGEHLLDASKIACDLAWVEVQVTGIAPVSRGTPNHEPIVSVPVGDLAGPVGVLRCQPRAGFELDADARAVLAVLAAQGALGIAQAQLTARIAHASAEERRRVERDLHDGAQQELVALIARLGLARTRANGNAAIFDSLQRDVMRILADLRALAQGIHPVVLTDGGLCEAIRDCADRLPLPIRINIDPDFSLHRPDPDIEAAAYFLVAEVLTNTVKHANASRAAVRLTQLDGSLKVEITDDGAGFDPGRVERRGLAGIEDRIAAHGGNVQIASVLGSGTTVTARIPSGTPG